VRIEHFPSILSYAVLSALFAAARSLFQTRAALQLEILALRHQLGVLQRSVKKPILNRFDRMLWSWFCGTWTAWRSALSIVKPDTVVAWHRQGFRLFWTWKVRRGQPGRPAVPKEIRKLIRQMSQGFLRESEFASVRRDNRVHFTPPGGGHFVNVVRV
jgi:hypothetical protein